MINPRGTSGAGKTWLVQQIMAFYNPTGGTATPIMREGRSRPIGWHLSHPLGGRPLAVIGDYQATRGGTDTIPLTDGGLDEAFRLADSFAASGHDVLMEGFALSGECDRTAALAEVQRSRGSKLLVLHLTVPIDQCIQNVAARRRASWTARAAIERTAYAGQEALAKASMALHHLGVCVERLDGAAAKRRALSLLGFDVSAAEVSLQRSSIKKAGRKSVS